VPVPIYRLDTLPVPRALGRDHTPSFRLSPTIAPNNSLGGTVACPNSASCARARGGAPFLLSVPVFWLSPFFGSRISVPVPDAFSSFRISACPYRLRNRGACPYRSGRLIPVRVVCPKTRAFRQIPAAHRQARQPAWQVRGFRLSLISGKSVFILCPYALTVPDLLSVPKIVVPKIVWSVPNRLS